MTISEKTRVLDRHKAWISTHLSKAHRLYIPMSGGTDSSLGFRLCTEVFPDKTVGVHIGNSMPLWMRRYYRSFGKMRFFQGIKARGLDKDTLRWALLNSLCKSDLAWLVGTRNRTEQVMGTYSLASRLATVQPLLGLWKGEVMELAAHLGVPAGILESSRRADPACGRPVEMAEIGLERVDHFARCKAFNKPELLSEQLSPDEVKYLEGIYQYNSFKAKLPIAPEL